MNNVLKKAAAGALTLALVLGCGGCGSSKPEVTELKEPKPTVQKEPLAPVAVSGSPVSPHLLQLNNLTAAPEYPQMPRRPRVEDYPEYSQEFYEAEGQWQQERQLYLTASPENAHDLDPFMEEAMKQFLSGDSNQVCAPLNIYFALAMLAETAGGNTRQQVLDLLGHRSMESLRAQANGLWRAHYCSDGQTVSLMANSVWLDESHSFAQDTLNTLAQDHYASVFTGDLGTPQMDQQLASWLDSQTGGLLTDYTQNIKLDPATVFCLASTAYFSADWEDSFYEGATAPAVFHTENRDVTTNFMNTQFLRHTYYEGEDFAAVRLPLSGSHGMWLILPDEGGSPKALLDQGNYYDLISHPGNWEQKRNVTLTLSMPKFDISSEQELIPGLKAMGITDACDPKIADYSPICSEQLYLSRAQHAARVSVDEDGVIAAAYTLMAFDTEGAPQKLEEINFTLDRPFLFAITGADDLPLFAGVVAEP